ncbi:hypothetical protein [[Phormidium] sp. ETS-05]|uniref:hypothetical protein n=1 Tax=[Phormidium] sp. ETS-05 TaxID=222819 RepID=UPI0018EF1E9C|nr:hypothetical protein [[Phormidium] sp. ETS-05]
MGCVPVGGGEGEAIFVYGSFGGVTAVEVNGDIRRWLTGEVNFKTAGSPCFRSG